MYSLIHDLQDELKEMEWKLSFLADYCDFIVKLSRYHNFSIPTEQLIQDYPLDRFVDEFRFRITRLGDNRSEFGYYDPYKNLTMDDMYELTGMILFFEKIYSQSPFLNSHDLIGYIRTLPNLRILFPTLMGKFETDKNEFVGFAKGIYEIICDEIGLHIKKGNAQIKKFTPLGDLGDL